MAQARRVIIFPFAVGEESPRPILADVCRGLACVVDETLSRIHGIETLMQQLTLASDIGDGTPSGILLGSMWSIEQVLQLPIPEGIGATHLLQGQVTWGEDRWTLELQLVDLETEILSFHRVLNETPEDFIPAFFQALREMVGEILPPGKRALKHKTEPITRVPAAFEQYLLALSCLMQKNLRQEGAEELFGHLLSAMELDRNFGQACARLQGIALFLIWDQRTHEAESVAALERGLELIPGFAPFQGALGMYHAAKGNLKLGGRLLREFITKETSAEPLSRGLGILGVIHRRQGDVEQAEHFLRQALLRDRENLSAWEELAALELDRGRLDEAEHAARRALDFDPERPTALAALSEVYRRRGDAVRALSVLRLAREASPEPVDHINRPLIEAAIIAGNFDEADHAATDWAENAPELPEPWITLARMKRVLGDETAAKFCLDKLNGMSLTHDQLWRAQTESLAWIAPEDFTAYESLLARLPATAESLDGLARLAIRGAAATLDAPGAVARDESYFLEFETLARRYPKKLPVWGSLTLRLAMAHQWSAAGRALEQVLRIVPETPELRHTQGILWLNGQRMGEAIRSLTIARELDPKSSRNRIALSMALTAAGQHERAYEELRTAQALAPEDEAAITAIGQLRLILADREASLSARRAEEAEETPPQGFLQRISEAMDRLGERIRRWRG